MAKQSNHEQYEVSMTNLYRCNPYLTTYLSQPMQYLLILAISQFCMVVYYVFTCKVTTTAELALTIIAHVFTTAINLVFPFVDPGIIPKILYQHEEPELQLIPFPGRFLRNMFSHDRVIDR